MDSHRFDARLMGRVAHVWHWLVIGVKLLDHPSQIFADEVFRLSVFALFTVTLLWRIGKTIKLWISKRSDSKS
ncbi:hypothetical protein ACFV5G_04230 [Streptomyces sp. NPDC059766]|uniref:hypothetical protein n=1 Tax=Streptomyces sp. NPDC059766 TaxID=3346940 RepID=UPI0036686B14